MKYYLLALLLAACIGALLGMLVVAVTSLTGAVRELNHDLLRLERIESERNGTEVKSL